MSTPDEQPAAQAPEQPEFGPGGFLPPRAASRARKIVLRERMGLHWPVAAAVAGVLILLITLPLVVGTSTAPGEPFVNVGDLDQVDPRGDAMLDVAGTAVLVVRGGGVLAAFVDPPLDARFCARSRRIEAPGGRVWSLRGAPVGVEADPLRSVPARAFEGQLYLDLSDPQPAAGSTAGAVTPACEA